MNYIKILNVFKEHSKDYIANNFIVPMYMLFKNVLIEFFWQHRLRQVFHG